MIRVLNYIVGQLSSKIYNQLTPAQKFAVEVEIGMNGIDKERPRLIEFNPNLH